MILSHAHIDHSGNLPHLVQKGYTGPIYCTPPTASLADIMIRDSGHIQEADAAYLNKHRARKGLPAVEPLYTLEDAEQVNQYFQPMQYDTPFEPIHGVTATLIEAGHILGAAAVVLDIQENGRKFRFWFSGDIGRFNMPMLKDPILPYDTDYLMMECTYGDRQHDDPEVAFQEFHDVVLRTVKRGGKLIIPSFAVGRTQELVYYLHHMNQNGELPPIPVYVDSPLAVHTSEIFSKYGEYFDDETRKFIADGTHPLLNFRNLFYTHSVEESKAINDRHGPMIIISASGMAETGRILHHLANNIEDARNTIAIVGWQAPDTLGRRLVEKQHVVKIFGENYHRKADVATILGLSAHAGQRILERYAGAVKGRARQIILVHGEQDAETVFSRILSEDDAPPIAFPALGEEMEI
jgi:metallo-beta-lactamase family protein